MIIVPIKKVFELRLLYTQIGVQILRSRQLVTARVNTEVRTLGFPGHQFERRFECENIFVGHYFELLF